MSLDDGIPRAGSGGAATPMPKDPAAIEALIERRRADLATTIDELVVRAHPREIARRSVADVRGRLASFAFTAEGQLRAERMAAVTAAGVVLIGLLLTLRRRRG
ncbi:MAG TPA: DUF3618 domain-containing protein [Kineosporiaceae bacterium]